MKGSTKECNKHGALRELKNSVNLANSLLKMFSVPVGVRILKKAKHYVIANVILNNAIA